ncbi:hypothetical protein KY290_022882 [Solanum tuberosum]|uniref:Uncharacterized protein n=1 Tax=Solanum tuberosum TaxID=4113 RepID=A0ABQ7V5P2_SOLTU|nr:hypothetical protein KY284_021784 [Solanum tuberosum]KAH0759389.1 hypothetical protein KY290_022882 [Solanum tuberosum]
MQKKNEQLKNGKAKVEAKLKLYLEKFKELESRVSIQEKEAAKNRVVDAILIQKKVIVYLLTAKYSHIERDQ